MSDAVVSAVRYVNRELSLWQCPLFRVSSSVAGFAMKPPIPLSQLRDGKISRKRYGAVLTSSEMSTQLSIGIKVPSDNVSMMHVY